MTTSGHWRHGINLGTLPEGSFVVSGWSLAAYGGAGDTGDTADNQVLLHAKLVTPANAPHTPTKSAAIPPNLTHRLHLLCLQGEAALFSDIKQDDGEQSNTFTTAVAVTSEDARLLRLFIGDFHPLVYHQHPGATAIVQRLGRIMVRTCCV